MGAKKKNDSTRLYCFQTFFGCRTGAVIQFVLFVCISFNFLSLSVSLCLYHFYAIRIKYAYSITRSPIISAQTNFNLNVIGRLCSTTTKETQNKTRLIEKKKEFLPQWCQTIGSVTHSTKHRRMNGATAREHTNGEKICFNKSIESVHLLRIQSISCSTRRRVCIYSTLSAALCVLSVLF